MSVRLSFCPLIDPHPSIYLSIHASTYITYIHWIRIIDWLIDIDWMNLTAQREGPKRTGWINIYISSKACCLNNIYHINSIHRADFEDPGWRWKLKLQFTKALRQGPTSLPNRGLNSTFSKIWKYRGIKSRYIFLEQGVQSLCGLKKNSLYERGGNAPQVNSWWIEIFSKIMW